MILFISYIYVDVFEDEEENKLIYTQLFNEYTTILEDFIDRLVAETFPGITFNDIATILSKHADEVTCDVLDMIYSLTDFEGKHYLLG